MAASKVHNYQFIGVLAFTQVIFLIVYGVFSEFSAIEALPRNATNRLVVIASPRYPLFTDTHAAIFAGFALLVVFLRRYGFSAVSINLLLAAFTVEWALIVRGLFSAEFSRNTRFLIGLNELVWADFTAAAVLISFGVLVGKLTPVQYLLLSIIETPVSIAVEHLILNVLQVADIGGAIVVHIFGAFFGLGVSRILFKTQWEQSDNQGSIYHSEVFGLIGTLLLWVFWPSFNAINAKTEDARNRAILNTYLALVGSTVWTFLVSQALSPNRKFTVRHIGSASLAGAVAIAACADIVLQPVVAVIIGSVAGIFSVIAFQHITPFLDKKLNVHDTRGVFSLHGLPAIVGAVAGAIIVFLTAKESYGDRATNFLFPYVATGEREWGTQGLLQLAGIAIAAGIALIAGIITGLLLRAPFWNQVRDKEYFADFDNFDVPADYDFTSRVISRIDRIELTEERIRLTGE